jgi:hypothetical protein
LFPQRQGSGLFNFYVATEGKMYVSKKKIQAAIDLLISMAVNDIAEEDNRRASDVLPEFLQSRTAGLLLDPKSRFWWDGPLAVKDFYREELKHLHNN